MNTVGDASSAPTGTSIFSARTDKSSNTGQAPGDLGKDDFMKLLLAQLQHQDPLKPMDDQAFIAQVAQFHSLEQMTNLNTTLSSVLTAAQLSEANGMIGKTVSATDSDGKPVTGVVTAASVDGGVAKLHLGDTIVDLDKVTAVASDASSLPKSPAPNDTNTSPDAKASTVDVSA